MLIPRTFPGAGAALLALALGLPASRAQKVAIVHTGSEGEEADGGFVALPFSPLLNQAPPPGWGGGAAAAPGMPSTTFPGVSARSPANAGIGAGGGAAAGLGTGLGTGNLNPTDLMVGNAAACARVTCAPSSTCINGVCVSTTLLSTLLPGAAGPGGDPGDVGAMPADLLRTLRLTETQVREILGEGGTSLNGTAAAAGRDGLHATGTATSSSSTATSASSTTTPTTTAITTSSAKPSAGAQQKSSGTGLPPSSGVLGGLLGGLLVGLLVVAAC